MASPLKSFPFLFNVLRTEGPSLSLILAYAIILNHSGAFLILFGHLGNCDALSCSYTASSFASLSVSSLGWACGTFRFVSIQVFIVLLSKSC